MKDVLCKVFCEGLTVQEVPVGLAIGTPFMRGADRLGFYVVYDRRNRAQARLEDDTQTITQLEALGVDLFTGPRQTLFYSMMADAEVSFDEVEGVLHTRFMPVDMLPKIALRFVAFLIRMQDFAHWSRERVEETFKHDVIQAVEKRFEGRAAVKVEAAPLPNFRDYVADVVIVPELHPPLALYVGRTETKALEALLLFTKARSEAERCGVMLVIPTTVTKVKGRTKSRMKSEFPVVPFVGHEIAALNEMERITFGEVMVQ